MTTLKMQRGTAHYLVSESANMYRSRDKGVVVNDTNAPLQPGTILGRLTTGTASAAANNGNVGNATVGAVVPTSAAKNGAYSVIFTSATAFNVSRPDGSLLTPGTVGTPYAGEIGFTITAGGTAMGVGSGFTITVASAPGQYKRHTRGASNGTQNIAGILFEAVGAQTAVERTVTARASEVNAATLVWAAGSTAANIVTDKAALVALDIIPR